MADGNCHKVYLSLRLSHVYTNTQIPRDRDRDRDRVTFVESGSEFYLAQTQTRVDLFSSFFSTFNGRSSDQTWS